ncbi:MAG TPA: ABC transporter permease [Tepidisphaeraceae bacterium]|jgi:ABC-type antimicrobial peptide transport system permease subunit
MRSIRTFKTAIVALRRNVMRAVLTTLGIVIGVGAVIAMMEVGNGSSSLIQKQISSMGANNLVIFSGSSNTGGISSGAGSNMRLTPDDAEAIAINCPAIKAVAPVVGSRTQIVYGGKNWVPQNMQGTTPAFLEVRDWPVTEGEAFTERDVLQRARVCLIGTTLVRELFGGQSPVGQEMRVNGIGFRVVGVLAAKGANMMGQDQDDVLIAPWTTIKYRVSGTSVSNTNQSAAGSSSGGTASASPQSPSDIYPNVTVSKYPARNAQQTKNNPMPIRFANIDRINASAVSADQIDTAIKQMTDVLRERHRLAPNEPDDFQIRSLTEFSTMLASTTGTMKSLLLFVATISLIVGGVGIMNIMLVSVTERTREIGLRMAVGARGGDILRQFLTESVVLCLLGGAIGIGLGIGASWLVTYLLNWPTESSPGAILAAVAVSAFVGVVFGFYPAWKAAKLDPIEALRYE